MDIESRIRDALRMKEGELEPSIALKEKILKNSGAVRKASVISHFTQLKRTAQITVVGIALLLFSGMAYAATTLYHYMDIKNKEGSLQHRLYVGEPTAFDAFGFKQYSGGWRICNPSTTCEDFFLVNYVDIRWSDTLEMLMRQFTSFKVPVGSEPDRIYNAFGYKDIDSAEISAMKQEARQTGRIVERKLVRTTIIDRVTLYYKLGEGEIMLRVVSFNNEGVASKHRKQQGYSQQFMTFDDTEAMKLERASIQQYDASYLRNGEFQSLVWEEEESRLQYTVISLCSEISKEQMFEFSNGLRYDHQTKR